MYAESRLATILQRLDVVIFEVDHEGVVCLSEGAGLRALGLVGGEVVGRQIQDFFHEAPWVVDCFRRGFAGESVNVEGEFRGRSFQLQLTPSRNEQGRVSGVLGIVHDLTERIRLEDQARTNERSLALLTERGKIVVFTERLDHRAAPLELSASVIAMLGFAPAELASPALWLERMHPDDVPQALVTRTALLERGISDAAEFRFRHRDGSWRWLRSEAAVQRDALGRPETLQGFIVDVTERHAARAYAQQSIGMESRVIAEAEIGIIVFDAELRYQLWNRYISRRLGISAAEAVGHFPWEVFPDVPRAELERDLTLALRGSVTSGVREMVNRATGEKVDLVATVAPLQDGDGKVLGVILLLRDITRERRLQEAVESSERSFRALIDGAPDGMLVQRGGRVVYANPSFLTLLGLSDVAQVIGRSVFELMRGDQRDVAARRLNESQRDLAQAQDYVFVTASGREVPIELRSTAITFEGRPSLLSVCRDQTERLALQAQLMASDRLSSVGSLAAGVAHEINNPLAAILANLESGLHELEDARGVANLAAALEPLRDARDAAVRLKDIARDLKLFSRAEDERVVPVDLAHVLDSTLRLAQNELRHRAQLRKDYRSAPLVLANESRLGQVFLNLVINATQAIPEGRAIDHEIAVSLYTDALRGAAVVEIRDSGVGIAPGVLTRIFDPFFTTKPAGVGTGLGLAVCKRLVTAAGGSITAESELGKGSLFRVVLPPVRAQVEAVGARVAEASAPVGHARGAVLVIDDDPIVAKSIARTLKRRHEVTVETDARAALARVRAGQTFDMILCDIMMPSMTGMEFHEEVHAFAPEVADQIVFMTGGVFAHAAREFLDRVGNTLVEKPFDPASLNLLIDERLRRARG